jgi:hypothetical protein
VQRVGRRATEGGGAKLDFEGSALLVAGEDFDSLEVTHPRVVVHEVRDDVIDTLR